MVDLNKPVNHAQFSRAFIRRRGWRPCCATGRRNHVGFQHRMAGRSSFFAYDGKVLPAKVPAANRSNSYLPEGWSPRWRRAPMRRSARHRFVAVAQRGKIIARERSNSRKANAEFVDKVTIHAATTERSLRRSRFAHRTHVPRWRSSTRCTRRLRAGREFGDDERSTWKRVFAAPSTIQPPISKLRSPRPLLPERYEGEQSLPARPAGKVLRTYANSTRRKPGTTTRDRSCARKNLHVGRTQTEETADRRRGRRTESRRCEWKR